MGGLSLGAEHPPALGAELRAVLTYEDTPPSLNAMGSGNRFAYQRNKKRWGGIFEGELMVARLPRSLVRVEAAATITFTQRRGRDEGNFRFFIEKALGDALQNGGWLPNDTPEHYRFGAVEFRIGDAPLTVVVLDCWP